MTIVSNPRMRAVNPGISPFSPVSLIEYGVVKAWCGISRQRALKFEVATSSQSFFQVADVIHIQCENHDFQFE